MSYGTLSIHESSLTDAWSYSGGALYAMGGAVSLQDSQVSDSSASYLGGGIVCDGCDLHIDNSGIARNSVGTDYRPGLGGGLVVWDSQIWI